MKGRSHHDIKDEYMQHKSMCELMQTVYYGIVNCKKRIAILLFDVLMQNNFVHDV